MEQLKTIKDQLIAQVQAQMGDLKKVNTCELADVIGMIEDLSKAIYYCEVYKHMEMAEEMEKKESNMDMDMPTNNYYFTERYYQTPQYYRDMDRHYGRMYYPEGEEQNGNHDNNYYTERDYPMHMRDEREGRSPMKRKMYMESKTTNADATKAMKDLESYMQDLTADMMELLDKASPEEKAMVQKKVNTLAAKIQNV